MVLLSLNGFISSLLASYFVKASAKNFKPFWTHARRVQARSYLSFLVDAHSREGMDILECLGSSSSQVGGVKKSALPLLCIVGMKDTLVRTHKTVETVRRLAPECDVVAVKDGCHALLVHDAHAEKTADVLLDFVNRCSFINKSAKTMTTSNVEWNDLYDDDEEAYDRKTMNALLA
jgi:pimeloyl-ACP methyl ester carboxylesterase